MSILAAVAVPSGFAVLLWALGVIATLLRRWRWSWGLFAASGAVVTVFSSGVVAAALMSPLEYVYPRIDIARHPDIRRIVVLTGWATDDRDLSVTDRLNDSSAYRVLLGLELYRQRPECTIVVSGTRTTALVMAEALEKLGIPRARLTIDGGHDSTADSAAALRELVGDEPFFLVTSAGHMPRSMAAMERQGLRAIAAPTEHQEPKAWYRAQWRPTAQSLAVSDLAVHEYFARVWERMRGPRAPAQGQVASEPPDTSS
jgi:uncharacterized SAM-binding protein YcdF (DUF218 family)